MLHVGNDTQSEGQFGLYPNFSQTCHQLNWPGTKINHQCVIAAGWQQSLNIGGM